MFDLILGCNTMKELGIVLDFRIKEITPDEISLPMRDIKNLRTRAAADKAWTVNNSIYQSTSKELQSTLEATKCLIEILDAKMKRQISGQLPKRNASITSVQQKRTSCSSSYKNLRSCLIEHWVTGIVIWSHSN